MRALEQSGKSARVRFFVWLLLIGWGLTVTTVSLSSLSRYKLGLRSPVPSAQRSAHHNHRLAHFAAFGSLSVLLGLLTRRPSSRIVSVVAVIALRAAIEVAQPWIYVIPVETADIRDDSYGAVAGTLCIAGLMAIVLRKESKSKDPPYS